MSQPTPAANASSAPAQVFSIHPIVLPAPGRAVDLQVRVSAPVTGSELPILLLSHGHGPSNFVSSLYGYAPLANYFAAHGFVVIQPTHLDSKTLPFRGSDHPDAPLFWRGLDEKYADLPGRVTVLETRVFGPGSR
jgi:predicted dienelactone hydrolase